MSHNNVSRAFEQVDLDTSERFVLVAIADCHNRGTGRCNPGFGTIARKTGLSRSSVIRYVRSLEARGLISRRRTRRENGLNNSNQYFFHWPEDSGGGVTHDTTVTDDTTLVSPTTLHGVTHDTQTGSEQEVEQEDKLASGANHPNFPQGQEKEKSCAGAAASSGLQLIAQAKAIAEKWPSSGTDHKSRWGLLSKLAEGLCPDQSGLVAKRIKSFDAYAKAMCDARLDDKVSESIGWMFALKGKFPLLPKNPGPDLYYKTLKLVTLAKDDPEQFEAMKKPKSTVAPVSTAPPKKTAPKPKPEDDQHIATAEQLMGYFDEEAAE